MAARNIANTTAKRTGTSKARVTVTTTTTTTKSRTKKGSGRKHCPTCGKFMQEVLELPSEHIKIRNELKDTEKSEFFGLLDRLMLTEAERRLMIAYYCEHKPLYEIAYELGYSEVGATKVHNRVLRKIGKLLK